MLGLGNAYFPDIIKYCFPGVLFEIAAQIFPGKVHIGSEQIQGELAAIIYGNIFQKFVNVKSLRNHGQGCAALIIIQSCDANKEGEQAVSDDSFASNGKMVVFVGNEPYQM